MQREPGTIGIACAASVWLVACSSHSINPAAPTTVVTQQPTPVTLIDVTTGLVETTSGQTGTWNWVGQSVTMPPGGPYHHLRFNWYTFQKEPTAFGVLHVLAQEFLGLPGDLGPSAAGYLGHSESVTSGQYVFPPGLTLSGGTRYWFYTDTQGACAGSFNESIYDGGDMYVTGMSNLPFRKAAASWLLTGSGYIVPPPDTYVDANFRLQGIAGSSQ